MPQEDRVEGWKYVTMFVLVGATLVLIILDIVIELRVGNDATISQVIYWGARANPALAFAAGVLCGHLFWAQDLNRPTQGGNGRAYP